MANEMMMSYKGKYCPTRQYMPAKPVKWSLKLWCLTDSRSSYMWTFDAYCGAPQVDEGEATSKKRDAKQGMNAVKKLVRGLDGRGHTCLMDNSLTSIELFREMEQRGLYVMGNVQNNRIGYSKLGSNESIWKNNIKSTRYIRLEDA